MHIRKKDRRQEVRSFLRTLFLIVVGKTLTRLDQSQKFNTMWQRLTARAWLISFKTALAAVTAMGLAMALGWDKPYWSGISAIVVSLPYVGSSIEKGGLRLIGTMLAGVSAYVIMSLFAQNQFGICLMLFCLLSFAGYMAHGKKYPYVFFLYGLTLTIICVESLSDVENLWNIAFFRVSEICLGVLVTLLVNMLVFPLRASEDLNALIKSVLNDCLKLLDFAVKRYDKKEDDPAAIDRLRTRLDVSMLKLKVLLPQALLDSKILARHHESIGKILQELEAMLVRIMSIAYSTREKDERSFRENFADELHSYTQALRADMLALAHFFESYANLPAATASLARTPLQSRIDTVKKSGLHARYTTEDLIHFKAYYTNLIDLENAIARMRETIAHILQPQRERPADKPAPEAAVKKWHLDMTRLKHGIKVPIAIIFTIYLWKWTQFPGGLDAVIMVTVLAINSMVASNGYSLLRLGRYLTLAGMGTMLLLILTPYMDTYAQYGSVLFVLLLFFSMVNQTTQGYAYAGFPVLLSFIQVTWIYNTQVISIKSQFETFIGVGIGAMITVMVLRLIWPLIPEKQLRESLCEFFDQSRTLLGLCAPKYAAADATIAAIDNHISHSDKALVDCETWIGHIGLPSRKEAERKNYQTLLRQLQALRHRIRALGHVAQRPVDDHISTALAPKMAVFNEKIGVCLQLLESVFKDEKRPTAEDYPDIETPLSQLDEDLHVVLNRDDLGEGQATYFLSVVLCYHDLVSEIKATRAKVAGIDLSLIERNPFF